MTKPFSLFLALRYLKPKRTFLSLITVISILGVTLGILWGAMPGLSTTMAMTLLIGLTVGMSQTTAIMFMLGVYTGSVFGGAISAVLINIPGTPDAVPTMMEGNILAQKGEGGLALGTAIAACVAVSGGGTPCRQNYR